MDENIMLTKFMEDVRNQRLFQNDDWLVLAVSGGVDSVVLADLCKHANFRFLIAHVNFKLRERESERDELFVRELAMGMGVGIEVTSFNTAEYASSHNLSIQVAARQLRYTWFETLRSELEEKMKIDGRSGRVYIVTAHHKDDSVETMLMNLFRGTGLPGLRGILPKTRNLVRPLLSFTKNEITDYASSRKLSWVEDSSNQLDKYTRNYFRNQLIPLLRNIYPQVEENLYNNLERFRGAAILYREAVDQKIARLVEPRGNEIHIPVLKLVQAPAYETILFEIIQQYGFTSSQLASVLKLLSGETGKQVLSDEFRIIKNRNWLIIAPAGQANTSYVVIGKDDTSVNFAGGTLELLPQKIEKVLFRDDKPGMPINTSRASALLDAKKISFPLLLRRWKQGDYFYPLGMKKKKKVARFLIDSRASRTDKESVWVLESDKKIIWVVGWRLDDRYRITENTREILSITYRAL